VELQCGQFEWRKREMVDFNVLFIGFTFLMGIFVLYLIQQLNMTKYIEPNKASSSSSSYVVKQLPSVFILFLAVISKMFSGKKKKDLSLIPLQYELKNVTIDRNHVEKYINVCGFPKATVTNAEIEVPLTYPQLLGFRMQLLLFLDKLFPFPAMGLVHMTNTVKQYRKVQSGMKVNVIVRLDDKLIIHPKGYCFDVICDIYSTEQKDMKPLLIWSSTSTYLTRKTHKSDVKITYESVMKDSDTAELVDIQEPWKLKGDLGRKYASVSEDYNPIHITAISASLFGFSKGCIAHGLWTSSKAIGVLTATSPSLIATDDLSPSSNKYLEYYVEYKTPIFLPNTVILTGKQEDKSSNGGKYIVQVVSAKDKSKPHMKGYLVKKSLK
jgi:acyl dehydratase